MEESQPFFQVFNQGIPWDFQPPFVRGMVQATVCSARAAAMINSPCASPATSPWDWSLQVDPSENGGIQLPVMAIFFREMRIHPWILGVHQLADTATDVFS